MVCHIFEDGTMGGDDGYLACWCTWVSGHPSVGCDVGIDYVRRNGGVAGLFRKVLDKCVVGDEFEDDIANYYLVSRYEIVKAEIAGIVSRGETIHDRTRLIADIDDFESAVVELVDQAIRALEPGVRYWYTGLYHYWWWDCGSGKDWPDVHTVVRVDALWGLRVWVGCTNVDAIDMLNCPNGCADLMEWVRRELGYE